jgi:hypothetical protein
MMMHHRRNSPMALRFAERREREDGAPRLSREAPDLVELRLEIEERAGAGSTKHTRRILVDRAPALFLVPCGDARCTGGGHDLTTTVMRALRGHAKTFEGEEPCTGSLGPSACTRVLHFEGAAEYREHVA